MDTCSLVNFESLQRQYAGHRHRILEEMFKTFVATIDADLSDLETGLSREESALSGQAAHSIAGAAAVLGLELLRQTALDIEGLVRSKDLVGARTALGQLPPLVSRSLAKLKEYVDQTRPAGD